MSAATVESVRIDRDHFPAWIAERPELFAQSVCRFLHEHPAEHWVCSISLYAGYIVRLSAVRRAAIAKATGELL